MLTTTQIQENKIKYIELLMKLDFDLTDLVTYLEAVNYFEAPNTTQYFRSYSGGLCQTALDLCAALKAQADRYWPGRYTEKDIIIVALFKNIYRAEMYELSGDKYKTKKDRTVYGDLGFSSYMTVRHFYKEMSDEQILAICHGSVSDNSIDIYEIRRNYPLVTLTMIAETLVTTFSEE